MAQGIQVPVTQSGLSQSINQAVKQMGTLNVPVSIDPSSFKNLAQPLGKISGLATEFEKSIAASNARVIAFGASVGIINGIQSAFSDLVKTGIEVQKTLAEIGAVSGKTGKDLSDFGDQIFESARKTGQSFQTASQAALEFSRQGLKSTEETIRRTNDALTLTRFTTLSAADAVDGLTAAVNTFSSAGVNTTDILNKLVALDSKYAVSAEDLIKGLARVGSVGQEAGVSLDELGAAITVVQEKTARGGAVIGNAFKTILTNLRSDTAVQALRDIGVESLDAQGKLKNAIPLLQELAVKIQGLSGGEKIQILESVASKYNINILSALLDDLGKKQSQFNKAVQDSAGAGATAYERLAALNQALATQINTATVSVTQLFNKLSEIGVTENLGNLLKFVNGLIDGFNKLLDSESVGGNVAKGLIKGLSDVLFSVGLPILAAIFIKLTKDIAEFGIESLKTILGINQQVRERQALEQAVVNTLIKDQEVMANILALSGDRAKQEQYLLGIYNAQINALQQVQTIAATVTPGLMGAGLSATSGSVKKRAASGYLPAQEAADVRRGVGGASPSSSVVSIPNFAFGGGKRGTMIANSSEYVVPNFANGGSAIFNQDMVKAYGLPSGAKRISAAGGYIPNFAEGDYGDYAALVGRKSNGKLSRENRWVSMDEDGKVKVVTADRRALGGENGKLVSFDVYGVPASSEREIEGIKRDLGESGKEQAVKLAQQITGNTLPSDLIAGKLAATFNPGSLASFAGTIFEASVGSMLGDKSFKDYSEQSVTSAFDLNIGGNQKIKDAFGIDPKVSALEIKGDYTKGLMDSVAKKIYQITEGQRAAFSKTKIGNEQAKALGVSRPITNLSTLEVTETIGGKQQTTKFGSQQEIENYLSTKYTKGFGSSTVAGTGRFSKNGSRGYVPNFANDGPLQDAVNREMAAGLDPRQIRVTSDGRLKNNANPTGLAVINTRDEPDGKVPNFASKNRAQRRAEQVQAQAQAQQDAEDIRLAVQGSGASFSAPSSTIKANPSGYESPIGPKLEESSNKAAIGLDKVFLAFSGLTIASNILETSFKDANGKTDEIVKSFSTIVQSASSFALLASTAGSGLKSISEKYEGSQALGGFVGKTAGVLGKAANALPLAGSLYGVGQGIITSIYESKMAKYENAPAKAAGIESVKGITKEEDVRAKLKELGSQIIQNPQDDKTNAAYEELKKKLVEINKTAKEKQKVDLDSTKELVKRIALTTQVNSLNEAFAQGEGKALENRAKRQSDFLRSSVFYTEDQKISLIDAEKLLEIDEKRSDLKKSILQNTIGELSKGALTTAEKERVDLLIERIQRGEQLLSIEDEIKSLNIQNNTQAAITIRNALSNLKIKDSQLVVERNITKERQDAIADAKKQVDLEKSRLSVLEENYKFQKDFTELSISGQRNLQEAQAKTPIARLENKIATQPFASREDEASLARTRLEFEKLSATRKIDNDLSDAQRKGFSELKDSLVSNISNASSLPKVFRDTQIVAAQTAKSIKDLEIILKDLNGTAQLSKEAGLDVQAGDASKAYIAAQNALAKYNLTVEDAKNLSEEYRKQVQDQITFQVKLLELRKKSPLAAGVFSELAVIEKEVYDFPETFGKNTTTAFRDGMKDALSAAISQTDNLGAALQGIALNFLKTMQTAFLTQASNQITTGIGSALGFKALATGGPVTGGSGYKDDVPAMLTGGEFVMRKSAVEKYGMSNLRKMNDGGIFLPGVRGGASVSGYDDLRKFANQTTTSGATDVLKGGGSSAFINLEDQSSKLSRWALTNNDTINQEIRSAQEQGLGLIAQREAYRTQQRKAMQQQIVGTLASAAISFGAGALRGATLPDRGIGKIAPGTSPLASGPSFASVSGPASLGSYKDLTPINMGPWRNAGGLIRGFSSGGSPTDNISAMLMDGEYVMSAGTSKKYGKKFLDSMNNGSRPRFAAGGDVGDSLDASASPSQEKSAVAGDVSIVINVTGGTADTQTQGKTDQGGIDYKKMSEKIKAIVLETITEEKRLGGSLRNR